ncbi:MAG: translocation/assembly module TamB domain-containing protein [Pararhodobacter sp.]|nr:translocation/assembly module TamB domain-containing protein [Pararhodobacter sp.]
MVRPANSLMAAPARFAHLLRHGTKWALALLAALATVLLLALPVLAQQQPNEDDVGFITRTLQGFLSDAGREVRIRGFEGALSSRARIQEMSIADDEGVWLILRDVTMQWNRAALLDRRVDINELSAREIVLLRPPVGEEDDRPLPSATAREPFSLPELPVSVRIGDLRAERVEIGAAVTGQEALLRLQGQMRLAGGEGEGAFVAERIDGQEGEFRFTGRFDNTTRQLALDLTLSEGPGGIAASLLNVPDRPSMSLSIAGEGPVSAFEADISLATEGEERVSGQVVLLDSSPEGEFLEGLNFSLDIGGDLRPLLAPDLHPFFGAESRLRAQGARSDDGQITLPELTVTTRTMQLVGRAALGEDMLPELVDVFVRLSDPENGAVPLPVGGGTLSLESAELSIEYDAEVSSDWNILAEIREFAAPELRIEQIAFDARGELAIGAEPNGDTPAAPFDGTFEFGVLGIAAEDPALQEALGESVTGFMRMIWPGNGEPAQITGLAIEARNAVLTAQGTLQGTVFDGFIEAELPDLTPFSALAGRQLNGHLLAVSRGPFDPLTGAFDLDLALIATDLRVDQEEFDNLVAGESTINMQISRDTEGTELRGLRLRAGAMSLTADGRVTPGDIRLGAQFNISDMSALGAGYGGRLAFDARYENDGEQELIGLEGSARNLRLGELPGAEQVAALLAGETQLSAEARRVAGVVSIEHARIDGPQLALGASGRWSDADTDLTLAVERLALEGLLPQLAGRLAGSARLTGQTEARRLVVELASDGALRSGEALPDEFLRQGARLDMSLRETGGGGVEIDDLRLVAQGFTVTGEGQQAADGAARFALAARLDDMARLQPGLRAAAASGPATLDVTVTREAGARDYATRFSLAGPARLALQGEGSVAPDGQLALRFSGEGEVGIANPMIAPSTIGGLARIDGQMQGPPALQSLRATLQVDSGRFVHPEVGFVLEDISASAEIVGAMARLRVDGRAARGGRLSMEGSVYLSGRRDVDLTVSGDSVRIYQPRLFEAAVSGSIRVTGPLQDGALISGSATVDQAEIRIPNAPLAREGYVPEGLTHIGERAGVRQTRLHAGLVAEARRGPPEGPPFRLDLTLDAPARVFVRGRGLDAELGGTLRLGGTTRDVIPSGGFSLIRGRLDLLGNRFALTDGSASMVGSFIPYIRLVATTDSGGVSTSIILEGEADAPEIHFRSSPELPQDEVLSRLIFGRSLATLSPFQAAQLAMSIATLAGRSEGGFLARTRATLGLDDLDVTTDDEGVAALRLGRYLGEHVYSDVLVDSEGRGEVSINLDLTTSVRLRARTDTDGRTGLGVFFERDY